MEGGGGVAGSLTAELIKRRVEELDLGGVAGIAAQFQKELDREIVIKEELHKVSRSLEKSTKGLVHRLQRIHMEAHDPNKIREIGLSVEALVREEVGPLLEGAVEKMPPGDYYKYADYLRHHLTRGVYAAGLAAFLHSRTFLTIDQASELFHLPTVEGKEAGTVFLEWEVYLEGMLDIGHELARFAKNSVIYDNYGLVLEIHEFITALQYGFSGVNFKNDGLRRKFDSLKYHTRSVEEVVYDLKMNKVHTLRKEAS